MNDKEKYKLITKNLKETIGEDEIKQILKKRDLKIYWGTAPTGNPSLGYLVPMYKIADFLKADCEVTILFADLHAYLDNLKTSWELLKHRTEYYKFLIKELLKSIGVETNKLKFALGSDFQLSPAYTLDFYKLSALTSSKDAKKAGAEVVKQSENPQISSLIYPILQALDEQHLKVDAQFGGIDQRKIFMFARENLPKLKYKKRIHLLGHLIPGLGQSGKMSSSEPASKIDFTDTDTEITKKINKAYSVDGVIEGNSLLQMLNLIIFNKLQNEKKPFTIQRPEKYGGTINFKTYTDAEKAFKEKKLSSIDLKQGIAQELIKIIKPIREKIEENIKLLNLAYPKK